MTMTVLIVDDHAPFRTFAHTLLEAEGFDVAGEAADGDAALAAAEELHPDVVLLDINLPTHRRLRGRPSSRRGERAEGRAHLQPAGLDYGTRLSEAPVVGFLPKQELSGEALLRLVA